MNFCFIHWAPDPVLADLNGHPIKWYAFLFACGLLGGYLLGIKLLIKEKIDIVHWNFLFVLVAIGAVVGARLGEVFFYSWPYYSQNPGEIIKIWRGGLASHGAVIMIAFTFWAYARFILKKPFLWLGDRVVSGIAFASACVRFGNLMNSEIVGKKTDAPWAFVFERNDAIPRHPTQLYEGIWYLILALCLFLIFTRKKNVLPTGYLSGLFFVGMFLVRFFLEFTKDDSIIFAGMNTGQLLSLPLIIIGFLLLNFSSRKRNVRVT